MRVRVVLGVTACTALLFGGSARAQDCDQDVEREQDICNSNLAVQTGDPSYCTLILGDLSRRDCYTVLSASENDTRYCAAVDDLGGREQCVTKAYTGQGILTRYSPDLRQQQEATALQQEQLQQQQEQVDLLNQQLEQQQAMQDELAEQRAELETLKEERQELEEQVRELEEARDQEPATTEEPTEEPATPAEPEQPLAPTEP